MELRKIEVGEFIPDGTVVLLVTKDSGNIVGTVRHREDGLTLTRVTGSTGSTRDARMLINTSDVYVLGVLLDDGHYNTLLPDTSVDLVVGDFVVDTSVRVGDMPVYIVITEVLVDEVDGIKYKGVASVPKVDESLRDTGGVSTYYSAFSKEEARKVLRCVPYKGSWFEHREAEAIGESVIDSRRGIVGSYYLEFIDALEKVDGRGD